MESFVKGVGREAAGTEYISLFQMDCRRVRASSLRDSDEPKLVKNKAKVAVNHAIARS
jgi:hypothetical protein